MVKKTARSIRLADIALLALIGVLGFGILLDGKAYNKPAPNTAIYTLRDTNSLEIHHDNKLIWAFAKIGNEWLQTTPNRYPVHQQRVQMLLDSNTYNQRYYQTTELPVDEIFKQPVTLKIGDATFDFGTIEPVSQLRYVRANNRVYLQPDSVMPLLSANNNAFLNLKITGNVQSVSIDNEKLVALDAWSNLTAMDLVTTPETSADNPSLVIQVTENGEPGKILATHTSEGYVISKQQFHYLLGTATAESIGLADRLTKSTPE